MTVAELSLLSTIAPTPAQTAERWPTLHQQPGRRLQVVHAEGEGTAVLHRQVADGQAVNFAFGAGAEMICGLELDSISHPVANDVGMGELHLERRCLPLCGPDVTQSLLDDQLSGCEKTSNTQLRFSRSEAVQRDRLAQIDVWGFTQKPALAVPTFLTSSN